MDLSKIMAVAGKSGLFRVLSQSKTGLIVESLADGKRTTVFSHEKISSLEEISIYTEEEDMPLKDVLKAIYEKTEGNAALSHKSDSEELKSFFGETVPDYDRENVYVSDIRKVIQWYNILQEHDMLDFTEEEATEDATAPTEEQASGEEKPDSGEGASEPETPKSE